MAKKSFQRKTRGKSPRAKKSFSSRKPSRKPSRKLSLPTKKKISDGLKRYWQRIRDIKKSYSVKDIRTALNIYRTREKVAENRFERIAIFDAKERPSYVSKAMLKKFGKRLQRGKDKGKIVLYYDRLNKQPIKGKLALRMRYENTVARLALRAQELTMTQQRYFVDRFWQKYAKKRGYLTEKEAKRMMKKILSLRRKDPVIRRQVRNIYGY